jgi:hypothetical protein
MSSVNGYSATGIADIVHFGNLRLADMSWVTDSHSAVFAGVGLSYLPGATKVSFLRCDKTTGFAFVDFSPCLSCLWHHVLLLSLSISLGITLSVR